MESITNIETLTIINGIANGMISISMAIFIIFVFGRNSFLYKRPWYEVTSIKMGLSLVACASLYNSVTLPIPTTMEVVMHIGLAVVFQWAVVFHWHYFIKAKKHGKKIH